MRKNEQIHKMRTKNLLNRKTRRIHCCLHRTDIHQTLCPIPGLMANKRGNVSHGFRGRKRQKKDPESRETIGNENDKKESWFLPGAGGRIPKKNYGILFGYTGKGNSIL